MQTAQGTAYRQQILDQQQAVRRELASRNVPVLGSVDTLLNAIFVAAGPERVAELESIPGVIAVRRERVVKKAVNRATQLLNAPTAWNSAAIGGLPNAGKGLKIAILDTGIDQTHPAFQDSSLSVPAGFPKCNVPSDCTNFTNSKVIVARSYVPMIGAGTNPSNPAADSRPDDFSARDRDGHGTGVASVAAANTNTGTVTFNGMAPKAYLGNYKIYGTTGVNDLPPESVWIKAIEDALNDGMDVANMSSLANGAPAFTGALDTGAACGNPSGVACDPLATAFEAAVKAGMVVTISAGNYGNNFDAANYPVFNSIGSPATAPSVLGVGATTNSHVFNPAVTVNASNAPANLKGMVAAVSDGYSAPSTNGANTAPLIDVSTLGNNGLACTALPAGSLANAFALVQRGTCPYSTKAGNASAAGAIGMVLYMADSSTPVTPEGICDYTSGGCYLIGPVVMLSLANGQALKSYLAANPGASVTIDAAGSEQTLTSGFNQLASYSSFGPTPDGAIKPDLVAVGGYDPDNSPDPNDPYLPAPSGMYMAAQNYDVTGGLYSANRYAAADGTSFAAPLAAGAAALVKQAHPTWTATQIKSALVNSANATAVSTDDYAGIPVNVQWLGAGLMDVGAAVSAAVTAEPSSVSFGFVKAGVLPVSKAITITNKGSGPVTLAVAVAPGASATGATVAVDQSSITLTSGASTTLNVKVSGTVPSPGSYYGAVTLKSSSVSLQLPYMFLVGDGVGYNVTPLFGTGYYGAVGQDLGTIPIQVTDQYGVPLVNTPVSFTISGGGVTLASVSGEPACSPANTSSATTCHTDNYGIAYAELIAGATPTDVPTIDAVVAGQDIQLFATVIPLPAVGQGGVVDSTSGLSPAAPGSYVSIYGSNMVDPNNLANSTGDSETTTMLPLALDGVNVSFDVPSAGISAPGYLVFVSPGQINIQMPWELQGHTSAQMKVTLSEGIFSNVVTVPIADYAPAFFFDPSTGVVAARDVAYAQIFTTHAATRGQAVQLYLNGLGPVTNPPASGTPAGASPLSYTTTLPVVTVGGQTAQVLFNGLAPGFPGLYQINIVVPANIAAGNQPISVQIGGKATPANTPGTGGKPIVLPVQ